MRVHAAVENCELDFVSFADAALELGTRRRGHLLERMDAQEHD